MLQRASVGAQPVHGGLPQLIHVLGKLLHHASRQHHPPALEDIGHLLQERGKAARLTAKEGDNPHHGEREEEHDSQCEDGDRGKLALLLTYPHSF
jgi:hypothetical protein